MTDYQPFDAGAALWQRTAAGDPGQEAPVLPNPMDNGFIIPGGPGDRAAGDAMNRTIVNPILGVWQDFKSGLPVAGTFLFLAVLFLVGLVMVFLGASGVGQAIESGARGEVLGRARQRGRELVPGGKKKEAPAKP